MLTNQWHWGKWNELRQEYIRHGTQSLIASWHVAKGQVLTPSIDFTRKEYDLANHIASIIETDPEAGWIFIVDQQGHPQIRFSGTSGGSLLSV